MPARFASCLFLAVCLTGSAAQELQRVRSPREMLDAVGIDASQLRSFRDDRPVLEEDQEALERILFRLPKFSQADVDRWTTQPIDIQAMLANPDSYRFDMFALEGQVIQLKEVPVIPELVPRLGFENFFEVRLRHDGVVSVVYVRGIPKRWELARRQQQPIREHVRVQALLLKRTTLGEERALVFTARRLNWHPRDTSELLGIGEDQVLLGQLGVDIDRLTEVMQKTGIVAEDRECLYQMLSAVRSTDARQLAQLGRSEFDLERMIRTPGLVSGQLYTLSGLARRAIKIHVTDQDIRDRFNLDHYFELEVFVSLERPVRFVDPDDAEGEGKVFQDYPFVVCVPELPQGMQQGDDIQEPITFSAFFMKLWAYRTEFMSRNQPPNAKRRLQQSPLLLGPTVNLAKPYQAPSTQLSVIVAGVFITCLLALWFMLWRASVTDDRQAKRLFRKHDPDDNSFESLTGADKS